MAPAQVVRWIRQMYPKPVVNMEWLDACCAWIADEMQLNPDTQTDAFIAEVENQLLESDFRDSMEPGTGLPRNASTMNNQRIRGSPHILVEITSVTEIGHSAFNLHNVRQARIERADLAGLAQEEGTEDDEGPVPSYPRSMLRFELSDGSVTVPAIEYRALPGLKLEDTPLGFKMLLKDVLVRRGILFLEPKGTVMKGHKNSDRDEFRDRDFLHGLFRRMMKPIPIQDEHDGDNNDENQHPPGPPAAPAVNVQPQARPPLREISEPPEPRDDGMDVDADADLPRKRRIPNPNPNTYLPPPASSSVSSASTNTLVASRFFSGGSSSLTAVEATTQRLARVLSPVRDDPIDITDSSMEDTIPPRPSSSSAPRSSAATNKQPTSSSTANGIGTGTTRSRIGYEEFEFDDDDAEMDSAFLDEIARVEREALAVAKGHGQSASHSVAVSAAHSGSHAQPRLIEKGRRSNTPLTGPSSSASASASTATPTTTATSLPTRRTEAHSRAKLQRPLPKSGRTDMIAQEVITIEDDEDEDDYDKENVPVPTRRVRRRVSARPSPLPDDVIDISD